jgi:phage-related protein
MPIAQVVFFADREGCPVLDWLDDFPKKVQAKAHVRIERLAELGHELRRPEADYLRDGIYELRWRFQSVNYRILYFFHGKHVVVLSNGLTKEDRVPSQEIELAVRRKILFETGPDSFTYTEE